MKANGSSNNIIEALCDRFPDGVPSLKRGASPTTTTARTKPARADRRLSRRASAQSPAREPTAHEPLRTFSSSRSSGNVPGSLNKTDTERLIVGKDAEPVAAADQQMLQREDALVLQDTEQLLRQMMEELKEARATSDRLASENELLRSRLPPSPGPNALQLGDDPATVPSSSQMAEPVDGLTNSHAIAAGQPMTPASLQQPQARLPHGQDFDIAPSNNITEIHPPVFSSQPPRPSSPVGLSRMPRIIEGLDDREVWRQNLSAIVAYSQEQIKVAEASMIGKPSQRLGERLKEAWEAAEKHEKMAKGEKSMSYHRMILHDQVAALKDEWERYHGELAWTAGERELETYPHKALSEEEKKNLIRFRNWAVHADSILLPLVRGYRPLWDKEDETDSVYWPPSDEDPDHDATSDATPSELEDVEMQDVDMSVEDDLVVGVEGKGVDALLTDMGVLLRNAPPMHTLRPTRATIPDPQGYVKVPQGRRTHLCWVPVKEKERVWVRCDQDVCTHGMETPVGEQGEVAVSEQNARPQGPCYFFDDLPEVAGRRKPKGRWVERDVDLLEGGKYVDECIKSMDESLPGLHGDPWGVVEGWKQRLERIPIWEH